MPRQVFSSHSGPVLGPAGASRLSCTPPPSSRINYGASRAGVPALPARPQLVQQRLPASVVVRPQGLAQSGQASTPMLAKAGQVRPVSRSVQAPAAVVTPRRMEEPKKEQKVIETITELLKDRKVLKRAVVQCFKRVVRSEADDSVDLEGLHKIREALARVLEVPPEAFGDLQNNFLCFDFDGSGELEVNEVYKLVKHQLRQYRKQLGGDTSFVHMPFRSLQQAGYVVYKELGRGSQGVAKLARDATGREFCVKCLQKSSMSASGIEELQEEFQTLQLLAHDNIAQVSEIFQDSQYYYMVGEPYHGGDFMTLTKRAKEQSVQMTEDWWRNIFRQCCEAIEFMHEQSMMHCDIKEPNLMLKTSDFREPEVVLIDFGVCKAMVTSSNGMPGGTPGYMPPETIQNRKWFPRGDVFAMGVMFIQVLLGKSPPLGPRTTTTPGGIFVEGCQTIQDIFNATMSREPPFVMMPPALSNLTDLLRRMLNKKMTERPTASQVLGLQWFEDGDVPLKPKHLRSRNDWATVGITRSFLERDSVAGENDSPAVQAMKQLQRNLAAGPRSRTVTATTVTTASDSDGDDPSPTGRRVVLTS
eukprot:TRINITY_DN21911_c0_g1_i2.p1 TRINITY_DN21911_c0_g1~~TRINITY_DN21911_c0_g1_i2.p1  ORF type:complete len:644 (+),score=127.87 TRINITY_DN21911_c0_g1_i2:174-1934(+)